MKSFLNVVLYIILTAVLAVLSFFLCMFLHIHTWIIAVIATAICVLLEEKQIIKFRYFIFLLLVLFLVPNAYVEMNGGSYLDTPLYNVHCYNSKLFSIDSEGKKYGLKGTEVKILGITVYDSVYKEYFSE